MNVEIRIDDEPIRRVFEIVYEVTPAGLRVAPFQCLYVPATDWLWDRPRRHRGALPMLPRAPLCTARPRPDLTHRRRVSNRLAGKESHQWWGSVRRKKEARNVLGWP